MGMGRGKSSNARTCINCLTLAAVLVIAVHFLTQKTKLG